MRPAIVFASPPARVSSSIGGNGALYCDSRSRRNAPVSSSGQPLAASAAATVRRTYGQRSRMMLARANSPVRLLPRTTPVPRRGRPSASGNPASASATAADVQGQPVRHVGGPVRAARDLVLHPVELEVTQYRGAGRVEPVRRLRIRGPVVGVVHPLVGQPPERPPAGQHVLPEFPWGSGIRIAKADANNGDPLVAHVHRLTARQPDGFKRAIRGRTGLLSLCDKRWGLVASKIGKRAATPRMLRRAISCTAGVRPHSWRFRASFVALPCQKGVPVK